MLQMEVAAAFLFLPLTLSTGQLLPGENALCILVGFLRRSLEGL
jgi:hypothetical protein